MLEQCLPYDPLLNLPSPVLNFKVRARQILLCFYFIFSTISNFSSLSVNEILLSHIFIYCEMPEVFSILFKTHLFTFTYFQTPLLPFFLITSLPLFSCCLYFCVLIVLIISSLSLSSLFKPDHSFLLSLQLNYCQP